MYFSFPLTPDKLTAAEQLIIEYITGHRDEFLCMTIGQLSDELNLSEATISRFARHVGCCDFKHLKRIIMEQTVQKGPAQKLKNTLQTSADNLLNDWIEQQQYYLQKTLELLDQGEFSRAVDAIGGARRVLEFRLRRIGIDVCRISSSGSELLENLALMSAEDLVVLFGFSKVSAEGSIILNHQKRAGYQTLLFTSRTYHDEKHRADINLFVYRGEENEYHSMTTPIAVVDALVLALSAQMGATAVDRLEEIRKLKTEYGKQLKGEKEMPHREKS